MKLSYASFATRWRDSVNLVLGLWLVASPWALGHLEASYATWNAWVLGVVIAVSALAALVAFREWEEWVSTAFGAWLVVSGWVLGYTATPSALWNHVIVGLVVAGMACWSIWTTRQHHQPQA